MTRATGKWRPALALVVLVLGSSAGFIIAFTSRFELPHAVVPVHLVLVTGVLVATMLATVMAHAALPRWPRLTSLPLALFLAMLVLVDAVNWVARDAWMEVISLRTMLEYAPRIYEVAAGATAVNGLRTLALVLLATALPAVVVLWCAPALVAALAATARARWVSRRLAIALLVPLAIASGASYWLVTAEQLDLTGEPLTGLFSGQDGRAVSLGEMPIRVPVIRAIGGGPVSRVSEPAPVTVVPSRKNVVIIVIDSLRPDHLSFFGYDRKTTPALDAFLAGRSMVVADWATSSCSISNCGILSILGSAQFRRQGRQLATLPDELRKTGYDTFFISSGDFTHGYPVLNELFGQTARMFVDGFSSSYAVGGGDDRGIVAALASIPRYEGRPAFFYFHLHSVHKGGTKYREATYHPSFTDTAAWAALRTVLPNWSPGTTNTPLGEGEYDKAALALNDYDNAVLQADDVFGRIIAELRVRGYLDESVVVVTADHGEALGEHGRDGHGYDVHAESINVPLFVVDSTFGPSRRLPYARQIDIAPTLLSCVGLPIPSSWEGQSLLSGPLPSQSFHQTTHPKPIEAVVWRSTGGTYKYIRNTRTGEESLYELDADPRETTDVLRTSPPELVSALRAALDENFATTTAAPIGVRPVTDRQ